VGGTTQLTASAGTHWSAGAAASFVFFGLRALGIGVGGGASTTTGRGGTTGVSALTDFALTAGLGVGFAFGIIMYFINSFLSILNDKLLYYN
jgi:hypothetical protein